MAARADRSFDTSLLVGLLPGVRQVDQQRRRLEAFAVLALVVLGSLEQVGQPHALGVAERPPQEGRESKTEDRPDVAVARAAQDTLAQATEGLVHHLKR